MAGGCPAVPCPDWFIGFGTKSEKTPPAATSTLGGGKIRIEELSGPIMANFADLGYLSLMATGARSIGSESNCRIIRARMALS